MAVAVYVTCPEVATKVKADAGLATVTNVPDPGVMSTAVVNVCVKLAAWKMFKTAGAVGITSEHVMVPAVKLPLASRATIALAVFADVAVVALFCRNKDPVKLTM